jgi:hypothetical protein
MTVIEVPCHLDEYALRAALGTGRVAAVGIACTWYPGHQAAARIRPYLEAAFA